MRVLITSKAYGTVDYTRHVLDGTLTIEDSINVPTLISFQLSPVDNTFVVPKRGSYVKIVSDVYAANGGYGSGKVLATGFISNELERQFVGLRQGISGQKFIQYTYNVNVTSDEWLLNCNPIPFIPAFVNQTDSQILAAIANAMYPGLYDTSQMAAGVIVPYFQYDPAQTWSDVAKTFADANRYHYKVIDMKIIYQPFGDQPLGISYDEQTQKEKSLYPLELKTGVMTVPPINDCIVLGDTEPQTNCIDYFVGDGFSSNFQLKHQVFQGVSSQLLSDDWTESSITAGTWIENDPLNAITLVDSNGNPVGALNVLQKGITGTYTPQVIATYLQAQNGLELGGGVNLQHGQFTFNDACNGLIGSVFPSSQFLPGNVLCGFAATGQQASGPYNVYNVITTANSNLVQLEVDNPGNLLPGNVVLGTNFTSATFLNGVKMQVVSMRVARIVAGVTRIVGYSITCLQATTYGSSASYAENPATVSAYANDVLVTASGCAGVVVQPFFSGQYVGQPVLSQINHQYVLQTWIGAQAPTRFTRPYSNLTRTATYGAQNLAASGTITWVITDYDLGQYVIEQQNPLYGLFPAAAPPVVTKYSVGPNMSLPPFGIYCLVNGINLNLSINYTVISDPPQGFLTVQSLTGMSGGNLPWQPSQLSQPIVYQLGFGMVNQTAQISQQGEAYALSFYTDDIPSVGARIAFQSWSAGQSVARVRDSIAVANEASISGDTGVRSAIMTNLSPLPRTSAECEAAAAAAILDREYPQFQGTYTVETIPYRFESLYSPSGTLSYPRTGEYFYVNAPSRAVTGQNFFVNTVRMQIVELRQEVMTISIDYGPDLYLEKLLPAFLEREQNLLTPKQSVPAPNYITLGQVLNWSLPTLDNAQVIAIVDSVTGNYITIDIGAPPVTGCEVRNVDSGWGYNNRGRVGLFTTQQFTLPRTARDQTWYLRTINGSQVSRYSKKLRVAYPLVPSAPNIVNYNAKTIVAGFAGDVRDIYGMELRALSASGVSGNYFVQLPTNVTVYSLPLMNRLYAYSFGPGFNNFNGIVGPNVEYGFQSQASSVAPFNIGDIVYATCPTDSSFNGFRVVAATGSVFNGEFYSHYCWTYEYGQPYPDTKQGSFGAIVGSVQSVGRNGYALVVSGSLINNVATIVTATPHNLTPGQICVIGAAYSPGYNPTFIAPYTHSLQDGAIFSTTAQVQTTTNSTTFTYTLVPQGGGGVQNASLVGLVAGIPSSIVVGSFFVPGAPPGTILQRGIFAPSDLVIDLSQPDIQATLEVLEAINPGSRIGGLALYFFNLIWDYSAGSVIPSFTAPSITGLVVVSASQGLTWSLAQGVPDGHRVETYDMSSGQLYSKYTVDHPYNPQLLTQANMFTADYVGTRLIKVTPFDALGDGIPSYVSWYGTSGGLASNPAGYEIGCTWNGVIPANYTMIRVPLDEAINFVAGWGPSKGYLETAPTSTLVFTIYKRSAGSLVDTAVATMTFAAGSHTAAFSGSATSFGAGDLLKVVSPGSQDATAADLGIVLSATQALN